MSATATLMRWFTRDVPGGISTRAMLLSKAVSVLAAGSLLWVTGMGAHSLGNDTSHLGHGSSEGASHDVLYYGWGEQPSFDSGSDFENPRPQSQSCPAADCLACYEAGSHFQGPEENVSELDRARFECLVPAWLGPLGPRHLLFELHQPNAPPLTA